MDPAELLDAEAGRAREQVMQLRRDLEQMTASVGVAADDEHDPEGTTAFERAQTRSLLRAAEHNLAEVGAARARLDEGTYGRCEECGSTISAERLAARPTARRCISCAARR